MQRHRGGRGRRKGDRVVTLVRLPRTVRKVVDEQAAARDMDLTDYLTVVIADALGVTVPADCFTSEKEPQAA